MIKSILLSEVILYFTAPGLREDARLRLATSGVIVRNYPDIWTLMEPH